MGKSFLLKLLIDKKNISLAVVSLDRRHIWLQPNNIKCVNVSCSDILQKEKEKQNFFLPMEENFKKLRNAWKFLMHHMKMWRTIRHIASVLYEKDTWIYRRKERSFNCCPTGQELLKEGMLKNRAVGTVVALSGLRIQKYVNSYTLPVKKYFTEPTFLFMQIIICN